VIDDDQEMRVAIAGTLERAGYVVIQGATAAEALTLTRAYHPAMVLLDVVLPDGDGMDIARQLKEDPELIGVFIVLLSGAKVSPEDQSRGFIQGLADGYIIHPVSPKVLCGWIEAFLRLRTTQEALREAAKEREKLIRELQFALDNIKTLQGLIPICANCKKIRDDKGYWSQVEEYIAGHTDAKFSHGVCPECAKKLYGDLYNKVLEKQNKKKK
jgi:DNA-binding response OmpR family regulator